MIEKKINNLKERLISEANLVQIMIEKSIEGLTQGYPDKLISVFKNEKEVNRLELEIEEICTQTIALYQPEAKHLRTVLMIYKINNDIERIGDQAVNIAESSQFLIERTELQLQDYIPLMAKETIGMIRDSLIAFNSENINLSRDVCLRDNKVDDYHEKIIRETISTMYNNRNSIERAMHIIRISKNLERIADLSTNIAEDTIFMVSGRVIKHNVESIVG